MTSPEVSPEPGPPPPETDRVPFSHLTEEKVTVRRFFLDRLARKTVTLGGWLIIFSILAILFVIVMEFLPLFKDPNVRLLDTLRSQKTLLPLTVGVDEYREIAYLVDESGIHFYSLVEDREWPPVALPQLQGARIVSVSSSHQGFLVLGLSDGRVLPVQVQFRIEFKDSRRVITPGLKAEPAMAVREKGQPVLKVAHFKGERGYRIAVVTGPGEIFWVRVRKKKTFMGTTRTQRFKDTLSIPAKGEITAMVFDPVRNGLIAGTTAGQILWAPLDPGEENSTVRIVGATRQPGIAVTRLGFLIGNYTLIVGDSEGGVHSYQLLDGPDGRPRLDPVHAFRPHESPVSGFSASLRHKGFVTTSAGRMQVHYGTTGETQVIVDRDPSPGLRAVALAPKSDGLVAADASGRILHWELDNPYPEISLKALFGKIQYEGYEDATYVWQSTGGTDAFESKFSMVPLIFGTLKGTLYAMMFAGPLALFGAFYTSQFMHPRLKGVVKPVIEIMAALPSVVLGFFAALLIAPQVEKFLPSLVLTPIVIPLVVLVTLMVYEASRSFKNKVRRGFEIGILIPLTLAGGVLAFYLGGWIESAWLMGDHRTWLKEVFQITYDQRNALVVGLAMGFAVIPIIFTIAEDSLSNVPEHLKASSLALGATFWQTALKVILPTASPGIFSAVMIGFGRAIGETMIVLMATGNTPVMDWSLFNGFRALSANIAVELPEAPEGGTLFRLLFLAAFILFVFTFFVNTLAEGVRLRLRKRYSAL